MAFYIVAAEEQGVTPDKLAGTIQNDILKEYMVRNTYIFPPEMSMKIIADIFEYTSVNICRNLTRFRFLATICKKREQQRISNLHIRLQMDLNMYEQDLKAGIDIDSFAPRLSFFWAIGMNYFMEVAKMRAARKIWAQMMQYI